MSTTRPARRRTSLRLAFLLGALLLGAPVLRADDGATWKEDLPRFLHTSDPVARFGLGLRIAREAPDATTLAAALPDAWAERDEAPRDEIVSWSLEGRKGEPHTIYAFAPPAEDVKAPMPLLVWLHGAVSRDQDEGGRSGALLFRDEARKHGFLVLAPSTRLEAPWWSPAGVSVVEQALAGMKRRYPVDADRVAVAGFSDGASGCYHLLVHAPDAFACFLVFSGNPIITRVVGGPCYDTNVSARPVYAVNGEVDRLYPAESVRPLVEELKKAGADIDWHVAEGKDHEISVLTENWDAAYAFWQAHPRPALPTRLDFATALTSEGRRRWVEIAGSDADAPGAEGLDAPHEMKAEVKPRPRLGVHLDTTYSGPGLRIEKVVEGSPAAEGGMEDGDVIVRVGDQDIAGAKEITVLQAYLRNLQEEGSFVVRRGEKEIEIHARPRVLEEARFGRSPELGYGLPAARVRAEILGGNRIDLETVHVSKLRLHLAPDLVDLGRELTVRWNGEVVYTGMPALDAATVLAEAVLRGPGAPPYASILDLEVPARN